MLCMKTGRCCLVVAARRTLFLLVEVFGILHFKSFSRSGQADILMGLIFFGFLSSLL